MSNSIAMSAARRLVAALLVVAAIISGCSFVSLGYGQLDNIAAWMANEYFDLDHDQRHEFNARFGRLHDWHRYEQLPDYVAFLGSARTRYERGVTRDDLVWATEGVKARFRAIARRASGDAVELLSTITPTQIDALKRRWDQDNRRFVRTHQLEGSLEDRQRARLRRTLSQIRDWTGSLSADQEQKITALARELPLIEHLRHEDRLRRQKEFLQLVELRGNRQELAAKLVHWLQHWEDGRSPEYERRAAESYEKRIAFFLAVDRLLTAQQRVHVMQRMQKYIDDFKRLSERGQRTAAN